jgi:hypothetical protein
MIPVATVMPVYATGCIRGGIGRGKERWEMGWGSRSGVLGGWLGGKEVCSEVLWFGARAWEIVEVCVPHTMQVGLDLG